MRSVRSMYVGAIHRILRAFSGSQATGMVSLPENIDLQPILEEDLKAIRQVYGRPKFFILGHARSGTTLLARLVRLHPDIHCNWQLQYFSHRGPIPLLCSEHFHNWISHGSSRWSSNAQQIPATLRLICDYLMERDAEELGKEIVGDKSPNDNGVEALIWLRAIYPDAKVVYIIRDGRDTILSKRIQAFIDQPQWLAREDRRIREALISNPEPFLNKERSIFSETWLEEAASKWVRDVEECVHEGKGRFNENFLVVKYEELIDAANDVLSEIWMFLDASRIPKTLKEQISAEIGRNPAADWHDQQRFQFLERLPRGVHGAWREVFTNRDIELFEEIAGTELKKWGYALDAELP